MFFSTWKASTIVFVLQLVVGGSVYAKTGSYPGSAMVVAVMTFLVLSGLFGGLVSCDVHMVSLPACIGAFAVFMATINNDIGFVVAVVVTILSSGLVTLVRQHINESPLPIFIAALPLGVGTVMAGSILAFRWLTKRHFTAS